MTPSRCVLLAGGMCKADFALHAVFHFHCRQALYSALSGTTVDTCCVSSRSLFGNRDRCAQCKLCSFRLGQGCCLARWCATTDAWSRRADTCGGSAGAVLGQVVMPLLGRFHGPDSVHTAWRCCCYSSRDGRRHLLWRMAIPLTRWSTSLLTLRRLPAFILDS